MAPHQIIISLMVSTQLAFHDIYALSHNFILIRPLCHKYIYPYNPYECVRLYELKICHYMPWAYSKNLVHWLHPHVEPKQFSLYQSQLNSSMITNANRIKWHRLIIKCVAWKLHEDGLYTSIFNWSYFTSMRSFNKLSVQSVITE